MRRFLRLALAFLLLPLAACSTVESRIAKRPEAFAALTPSQREAVRRGEVREGMSQEAVWMAWGRADEISRVRHRGRELEYWTWFAFRDEPRWGWGYGGPGWGPGYGGPGYGGWWHSPGWCGPVARPVYVTVATPWREAIFEGERLVGFRLPSRR
jgi:hypothetical protein